MDDLCERGGQAEVLGTTRVCLPAHRVFDPEELEERIQAHKARVKREERLCPEDAAQRARGKWNNRNKGRA